MKPYVCGKSRSYIKLTWKCSKLFANHSSSNWISKRVALRWQHSAHWHCWPATPAPRFGDYWDYLLHMQGDFIYCLPPMSPFLLFKSISFMQVPFLLYTFFSLIQVLSINVVWKGEELSKESDQEGCEPTLWRRLRRSRWQEPSVKLCGQLRLHGQLVMNKLHLLRFA